MGETEKLSNSKTEVFCFPTGKVQRNEREGEKEGKKLRVNRRRETVLSMTYME